MYRRSMRILVAMFLLAGAIATGQGTRIDPPKNSYSPADDVKLGRQAAAEVTRELPVLPEDTSVDSYVERVGSFLVDAIPEQYRHSEFRYEFSVVNASDINAFALPGGPMFVNRGMIEAAHSEGEMAGVMAHEISHVALRHGTAQATKSQSAGVQLGAIGGAILGAIIGGNVGDVVAQGTQFGLGTYLLKFSREYETQADILGAQILARAGYDPKDLARMFQTIEQQGGSGGPEFLSSHPNPGNRSQRISDEAARLTIARNANSRPGDFAQVQTTLRRMAPAPSMEAIMRSSGDGGNRTPDRPPIQAQVDPPSGRYRTFEMSRLFRVSVPTNWREFAGGSSVTFAPDGAFGRARSGEDVFTHGAIMGVADIGNADLSTATDRYISGLLQDNTYLRAERNYKRTTLDRREALSKKLSGTSDVTGKRESVNVYTTMIDRGLMMYMVQVSPEDESRRYRNAFNEMVRSVTAFNY